MTDLIPRDVAIAAVTALIDHANKQGLSSVAIIAMSCRQDICAIPAIDPAAIRDEALKEAADHFAGLAVLRKMWSAAGVENTILSLIGEKK